MGTGILLTARLGSSRLKKKHLLTVNEQPILVYLVNRIQAAFQQELSGGAVKIVIATSDEPENREFEMLCLQGVGVFYGSLQNIPLRHLQAAEAYGFDHIIAVDGDDILCSVEGMRQVYQTLAGGKRFVKTNGLPFGMNVMGYTREFLQSSLKKIECQVLETGWGRIFDESEVTTLNFSIFRLNESMRFTLDYSEDFIFFEKLITGISRELPTISDQEIVDYVAKNKLYEITVPIATEYWNNFNKGVDKETDIKRDDMA